MARSLEIAVISLNADFDVSELKQIFPSHDVFVQQAVDLRKTSTSNLYSLGLISASGYTTLQHGRKWHWELNSKGGVGLAHANRIVLGKNDGMILLLEDDFKIRSVPKLKREMSLLTNNEQLFDIAVFGALYKGDPNDLVAVDFMPDGWYYMTKDKFWFLHCALYSSEGRKKIRQLLSEEPLDMQIDGLFSHWCETRKLRIILQVKYGTVGQRSHKSTIQTDNCTLCDISPSHPSPDLQPYKAPAQVSVQPTQYNKILTCLLIVCVIQLMLMWVIATTDTPPSR